MSVVTSNNKLLQSSNRIMINSGEIIKDSSLVYWYDPSRALSYPGSGNEVFDLSGNNFHATTHGSVEHIDNNYFRLRHDGDYYTSEIHFPGDNGGYGFTYDLTITLWFKTTVTSRFHVLRIINGGGNFEFDVNDTDGAPLYKTMWVYWNSDGAPLSALPIGALGGGGPQSDLVTNTWQCYTFRRNVNTDPYTEHFVNGVKVTTVNRLASQTASGYYGGTLLVGATGAFRGDIGSAHAYSRALTDNEIMHNYHVEKNRFKNM